MSKCNRPQYIRETSHHPAAHRSARSCSLCSPHWSSRSRQSSRHTSCKETRIPWRHWHSAWWQQPARCWNAWHGRNLCGRCWWQASAPAAVRGWHWRGRRPRHCAYESSTKDKSAQWMWNQLAAQFCLCHHAQTLNYTHQAHLVTVPGDVSKRDKWRLWAEIDTEFCTSSRRVLLVSKELWTTAEL